MRYFLGVQNLPRLAGWLQRLLLLLTVALLLFPLRPAQWVTDTPLIDDSYMYLAVARHMAHGHGISDDGVNPTNGIQPLFAFLIMPFFWVSGDNPILPIRFMLLLHLSLFYLSGYVLSRIVVDTFTPQASKHQRLVLFRLTLLLFLGSVVMFFFYHNGLETGLTLCLYVVFWRLYQITGLNHLRDVVKAGILLGLLILSRIDAGFFAVIFAGVWGLLQWRQRGLLHAMQRVLIVAALATLISLPWWLYNLSVFGNFVPTSGRATSVAINEARHPIWPDKALKNQAGWLVLRDILPIVYVYDNSDDIYMNIHPIILTLTVFVVVVVLSVYAYQKVLFRATVWKLSPTSFRSVQFLLVLLLTSAALIGYYVNFQVTWWFYQRYFSLLTLVSFVVLIIPAVLVLLWFLRILSWVGLGAYCAYPVILLAVAHTGMTFSFSYEPQLRLIEQHVPATEWVASVESGYVNYFRGRVINLDGKTNAEMLPYLQAGDVVPYVQEQGIQWMVVWQDFALERFTPQHATRWIPVETSAYWTLYRYQAP